MKQIFCNKKITGVLTILPEHEAFFDDEVENYNFPVRQTMRLKKVMGYEKHRLVKETTTVSDLCVYGLEYLIREAHLQKDEIDALLLVTQSPDHFIPPTSNVIQGRLGLKTGMLCMDINQGCCGYLLGLMQAFMLLDMDDVDKVVLLNADILSKKVCKHDRNGYPLSGDAASITIVESAPASETVSPVYFNMYMDGRRNEALQIPAGAFRMPSNSETAELKDLGDGNLRSLDNLTMDGGEVFNFAQREVPSMIEEIIEYAGITDEDIDYYLFHQPNKFMLGKLAAKMKVNPAKMPMNVVENYGNSSGCTIPVNIVHNLGESLLTNQYKCCLAGFGSGLTWSSMIIDLGKLKFSESIIAPL